MIPHTPLDLQQLSPAAQRALGPGPGRTMAARGIMPLPPADQLAVLYQLAQDGDAGIAQAARTTALGLPDKLLAGTLADPAIDRRVLDYFATIAAERAAVVDAIVLNPTTADETIATLAGRGGAREIDLIAGNEQRLLRYPEIIASMYMNRRARMSTVDRVVELAVRNNVRVPGLAAWDEVARAITGAPPTPPEDDGLLEAALADPTDDSVLTRGSGDEVPGEDVQDEGDGRQHKIPKSIPAQIRLATLGNAWDRAQLIRSPLRMVALATVKSPGVKDVEVARWAGNQTLHEDVIRHIAGKREWTKLYGVKVSLCRNPKTPMAEAARMLPFLREKDLANLAKSKGIPSAVSAQARKLVMARKPGGKP